MIGAFASSCADYAQAGWTCVIPVPPEAKFPPPEGFTGSSGRDTSTEDLISWAGSHASHSVALRLPDGVIGIDVDDYEKNGKSKHGASTLAQREQEWGPLPATWSSTARGNGDGPGPSRIMFFRVPPGRYATGAGPDIDVIQRHHRYTVVAPSVNPETGTVYRWYDPDGLPADRVPSPEDLAWLPESWAAMLAEGATAAGPAPASRDAGQALLDILLMDRTMPCAEADGAGRTALAELLQAAPGSRHDLMTGHVYHVIQLGAEGHAGTGWILAEWLEARWDQLTAGEGRDGEFANMLLSAARKAATAQGAGRTGRDPCLSGRALGWESPVPAGSETAAADMLQAPAAWSPREAWGAHVFETKAQLDSVLARDVLARTHPGLRYAADAAAWIIRGPLKWESRKGEQARWAVEEMFWLMPRGDPDADKSTEEYAQAARRARFGTNAGAGGIAGKMQAQVLAGHHPCAVELAGLDADADILWAGGIAWDLRASLDYPVIATRINPGTPHMHTAACVPEVKATPLWDAFARAVWPDEEMRRWALRVLAVAFTGYPDKSLPILLGPTDRGKTELVKLLMSVLGTYALKSADARLLNAADRSHASIVYALKGCRLAFIDEAPRAGHLAQERLKSLTGGAPLTGNRMGENPITFNPSHTMILTANPESEPVLTDPAVRRRVRLLVCDGDSAEIRAARAAIGFLSHEAWRAEAPGVLARMMTEAAAWIADPLSAENDAAPAYVQEAAEQIALMQDTTGIWAADATERYEPGTRSHALYEYFVAWCKNSAIVQIPSETRWGRRLSELGYPSEHRRDGYYRALCVRQGGIHVNPFTREPPSARKPAESVTGYPPDVTGSVTGSGQTRHTPNASSNPSQPVTVTGVTGTLPIFTRTRAPAPAHTQESDIKPVTPVNPSQIPGQGPAVAEKPVTERVTTRHEPGNPPATRKSRLTDEEKAARKQARDNAKRAEREAARRNRIAELGGPPVTLPAIVTRDQAVRPCDAGAAAEFLAGFLDELSVDVETSGFPLGHDDYRLRLVQLGGEAGAVVLDPSDPLQAALIRMTADRARELHAHSALADLVPLEHAGLCGRDAWDRMTDTVILAKLTDPALADSGESGLKPLARALLGEDRALSWRADRRRAELFAAAGWLTETEVTTPPAKSGWAQVPFCEAFVRYAASDVMDCAAVARVLQPGLPAVLLERERKFARAWVPVALKGTPLDAAHVRAKIAEHERDQEAARGRVEAATDGAVTNPKSPVQVPEYLGSTGRYELPRSRKTGKPGAAKGVLEPYAAAGDSLAADILEYRRHDTALGLLLRPWHAMCERGDGRIRSSIMSIEARTGRTSSRNFNMQQVSRQGGMRACVLTEKPGETCGISADFSAVEIRVGAALSGDENMKYLIEMGDRYPDRKKEFDFHWRTAVTCYGENATKENRYNSKRINFAKMFGSGKQSCADMVGVPLHEVSLAFDAFTAEAPRYAEWDREMRAFVRGGGRSYQAYSGRQLWFDMHAEHGAGNTAIQGTARELAADATLKWLDGPWGGATLLLVHDELIAFDIPAAEAQAATEYLVSCMETDLYGVAVRAEASDPWTAWPDAS